MNSQLKIVAFLIISLCIACKMNKNVYTSEVTEKKSTQIESSTKAVMGNITYTEQYCGGAPPPQDILDELNTPKPYKSVHLYIRKGNHNYNNAIISEIITDEYGNFAISLPIGNYTVVSDSKKDIFTYDNYIEKFSQPTKITSAIDKKCIEDYMNTPDFTFSVTGEGDKKIQYNYFKSCNYAGAPCVQYNGQYPQ